MVRQQEQVARFCSLGFYIWKEGRAGLILIIPILLGTSFSALEGDLVRMYVSLLSTLSILSVNFTALVSDLF